MPKKYSTLRLRRYKKGSRRCHNKRCVVTKSHVKTRRCYSLRSKRGKKTSRYAGGATTEQIGASAQMRVALKQIAAEQPMNRNIQTIINSLNDNVHSNELTRKKEKGARNSVYDPTYSFDGRAQDAINAADIIIKEADIPADQKALLHLAKIKAEQSERYGSATPPPPILFEQLQNPAMFPGLGSPSNSSITPSNSSITPSKSSITPSKSSITPVSANAWGRLKLQSPEPPIFATPSTAQKPLSANAPAFTMPGQ